MDRRNFLRSVLGVAAATALPSEVWPFRKIFLPPAKPIKFLEHPVIDWSRVDVLDMHYWGMDFGYPGKLGLFLVKPGEEACTSIEIVAENNRHAIDMVVETMRETHCELLRKSFP